MSAFLTLSDGRLRLRIAALFGAVVMSSLTCRNDLAGPGKGFASFSVVPRFESSVAGIVPLAAARVVVRRADQEAVALDTVVSIELGADSLSLNLRVLLLSATETFQVTIAFVSPAGDTVFRGGPLSVTASAQGGSAGGPTPVSLPIVFVGVGANAARVVAEPAPGSIITGDTVLLTATAYDSADAPIPGAYIGWISLDTARATVPDVSVGWVAAAAERGTARITAVLVTGPADTVDVNVQPAPTAIVADSGSGQTGFVGSVLPQAIVARVTAADGLGVEGLWVRFVAASGSGTVAADSALTDAAGRARTTWTLGAGIGARTVTASTARLTGTTVFSATAQSNPAATIIQVAGDNQTAPVGTTLPINPAVLLTDGNDAPVVGGQVAFAVTGGGGSNTGGIQTTNASGIATVSSWTLGALPGVNTLTASTPGLPPVVFTATGVAAGGIATTLQPVAGGSQTAFTNDTVAVRPRVRVVDAVGAPVAGVGVTFAIALGGGTIGGASTTTDTLGLATAGQWRMGPAPGPNSLTVSVPSVPAVTPITFTATAVPPPPVIQLSVFGSNVVGQARTGQLNVRLLQAAPAGGLSVSVVSDSTQYLTVGTYGTPSGTVAFAVGDTLQSIVVFGDSIITGVARVRASASGYTPDTLDIPVSQNLISLPPTLNVPLNQSVSIGVTLSTAAPAGGVKIALSSSDPATVAIVTDTVIVAQGSVVGSGTVQGAALGSATVFATNPNYAPFQSTVSVTASLNITVSSVNLNASFGLPITVELLSGGIPVGAPAGGVAVTFTSRDTTCATVPNTTIGAGLVSVTSVVSYGGGAANLPCNTYIVASGPAGFVVDSVLANVAVQPAITVSLMNLGSGLQRAVNGFFGASNHGGTTVRVTSLDPTKVLLSRTDSTPGSAFIDVPVPVNQTSFLYYVQGVEGLTADTVTITATAPGFVDGTNFVRVWQPVLDVVGFANGTSFDVNRIIYTRIWTPSSPTGGLSQNDAIRAGGTAITTTIALTDTTVGKLVTQAGGRGDSVTAQILPRQFNSPTSLVTGGVEFDYLAAGTTIGSAGAPGVRSTGTALGQTVTVTAPALTVSLMNLGSGLQRAVNGFLGASQHGGVTVRVTSADPTKFVLATNDSTPGTAFVDIAVPNGQTSFLYWVQGIEGLIADTAAITATAPGFTLGTNFVRVWQPVLDVVGFANGTSFDVNRIIYTRIWTPSSPTGGLSQNDAIRAGGTAITTTIALTDTTVGKLVTQAGGRGDSVTAQILPRQFNSPTSLVTGGVEFDYLAAGTTIGSAGAPGVRSTGTALGQTVTVTAPAITVSLMNLGSGLQRAVNGFLGASQHGGVTVRVTSADPTKFVLATNDSTPGTAFVDIAVTNGQTSFLYWVQGIEGLTADTAAITATAPGFTPGTNFVRVWQPVSDIVGLVTTATTLTADRTAYVRLWTPSSPTGGLSQNDALRAGATPLTVTINSSAATVAQLVTQTTSGSQATVTIGPRQFNSPTSVVLGGVALDYLTAGTTVISANVPGFRAVANDTVTVTVTAPVVAVGTATVGSALQVNTSLSLSAPAPAGGVSVTVSSSNPALVLVAPNSTTPGAASFTTTIAAGQSFLTYYVAGVEGLTGASQQVTIRGQATGYTDGTATTTVVQSGVQFINLVTNPSVTAANRAFYVRVGVPNSPSNTVLNSVQAVRAGGPTLTVSLTSSDAAVAQLVTQSTTGGAVSVQILPEQFNSPTNLASGGVEIDYLTTGTTAILAAITNFLLVPITGVTVIVVP